MKSVWKFELPMDDIVSIEMPYGAELLSVDYQPGVGPCIWALVDPSAEKTVRRFRVAGTGHTIDGPAISKFLGTFMMMNGGLVFHVFEVEA